MNFTNIYSDIYKKIIREKDKSYYNYNPNLNLISKDKRPDSNFQFIIKKYTKDYSEIINKYLRESGSGNYSDEERKKIESFIYCLHSLLQLREAYYVENDIIVYKGVNFPIPENWKKDFTFLIGEFVSTTLNKNIAKLNSKGKILSIQIKNNGANGQVFYCRNIQRISYYPMEQEILITAFSKFKYIREDDDMIYLECLGY